MFTSFTILYNFILVMATFVRCIEEEERIRNVIQGRFYVVVYGTKYSGMDQVKCFKGCLSQILLGPFLNTLSYMTYIYSNLSDIRKD